MCKLCGFASTCLLMLGLLFINVFAQTPNLRNFAPIDINQWKIWFTQEKTGSTIPDKAKWSGFFPQETAGLIYVDGLLWGGYVRDGREPALRVGGSYFYSGVHPGWIIKDGSPAEWARPVDPRNPRARIYRIRRDIFNIDPDSLRQDAASTFNIPLSQVTDDLADSLRQRYINDWNEWPADLGAPYYDRNQNGQYDPDYDEPGFLGADQLIWYVVNDASEVLPLQLFGSPPIGIELQVTIWAYRLGLSQTVFRRYRLINKSGATIDSMFVSIHATPDVGYFGDNLAGCDSAKSYAFVYNGYPHDKEFDFYNMAPPSVAYLLLQGPAVADSDTTGIIDFKRTPFVRNLPMTSFWLHQTGGSVPEPFPGIYEDGTLDMYAIMNGYARGGKGFYESFYPVSCCRNCPTTKFPGNGNPLTGEGDIDGSGCSLGPGVRYFFMNSGPFTMQPGDFQDIIVATVGALPDDIGDNYSSLKNLFRILNVVRKAYRYFPDFEAPSGPREKPPVARDTTKYYNFKLEEACPNPFKGNTLIKFQLHANIHVHLTIYNLLGQKIRTLFNGNPGKGEFAFRWDGRNESGTLVPSGIYLVQLKSNYLVRWGKILFLK